MFAFARTSARHKAFTKPRGLVAEQRRTHRIHTVCRFARVKCGDDEGLWRISNISDEGVMLKSHRTVDPGERLSIAMSDSITLEAVVIWSDGECCGARFEMPVEAGALLRALAEEQRSPDYRALRLPVDGWALAFDDSGVHPVRLRNLSRNGAGLSTMAGLKLGTTVKLILENGAAHRGVVRWADEQQAGLLLLDPLSPLEMASASQF